MIGRIHSVETFGTVDGPGIRFVLFMQGCALQCLFCHNPDSWNPLAGREMSVDEVLAEIEPYIPYYKKSGGGITVTGGEPTLQAPFITALFKACKERWNLHTTIDSSGFCDPSRAVELMEVTDLVLLDLKQMNTRKHKALTSQPNERILTFAHWLSHIGKSMWIRTVLIPGYTDEYRDLVELGRFIGGLQGVEKVDVLPYHRMGVYKWQELGKTYELEGVEPPTDEEVKRAISLIEQGRKAGHACKAL